MRGDAQCRGTHTQHCPQLRKMSLTLASHFRETRLQPFAGTLLRTVRSSWSQRDIPPFRPHTGQHRFPCQNSPEPDSCPVWSSSPITVLVYAALGLASLRGTAEGVFGAWMCGLGYPSAKMCTRALVMVDRARDGWGLAVLRFRILVQNSEESEF